MNHSEANTPAPTATHAAEKVRRMPQDEILRELWETKARLNAAANFDPTVLIARANETARRLGFLGVR